MSANKKIPGVEFIIDSSRDRHYPLFISEQPEAIEYIQSIPLNNISWEALETLAQPDSPRTTFEALLIPTDSARTISVVVGTTVIGTLPDPSVVADSQIARVYASGFLPSCQLVITPGESVPAKVRLYTGNGGVPFNDPPHEHWALLPGGAIWRVEPTRNSPFEKIPHRSKVFVEIRPIDDLLHIFLDGVECGILDIDAADAMCGGVRLAIREGYTPIARGCVEHHGVGHVVLRIDAKAFDKWDRSDLHLPENPLSKLIPYEADPLNYQHELHQFIRDHEKARCHTAERRKARVAALRGITPYLMVLFGLLSLIITVAVDDLSAHGTVGLTGISSVLIIIGTWILACRKRDTSTTRQTRYWNFLIPLSVSALIPSVVFANIGIFYDGPTLLGRESHTEMTTLRHFPGDKGEFSTLMNKESADQPASVFASGERDTTSIPAYAANGPDQSTPPTQQPTPTASAERRNTQNTVSGSTRRTPASTPETTVNISDRTSGRTSVRTSTTRESSTPVVGTPSRTSIPKTPTPSPTPPPRTPVPTKTPTTQPTPTPSETTSPPLLFQPPTFVLLPEFPEPTTADVRSESAEPTSESATTSPAEPSTELTTEPTTEPSMDPDTQNSE